MKNAVAILALALLAQALLGCGSSDGGQDLGTDITKNPTASKASDIEAKVKAIEDNPNIPAGAKANAIAAVRANGGH